MDDVLTGATAEVELTVDLSTGQIWDLVSDVTRIGEWSPECVRGAWVHREGSLPSTGDRFEAYNEYPGGFTATVEGVVTEAERPRTFAWVVLDGSRDVARPGTTWRYELEPAGESTIVRHTATHGPGQTRLREIIAARPGQAAAIVERRMAMLRDNMTTTLRAMTGGAGA